MLSAFGCPSEWLPRQTASHIVEFIVNCSSYAFLSFSFCLFFSRTPAALFVRLKAARAPLKCSVSGGL